MRSSAFVLLCLASVLTACGTRSSASVAPVLGATALPVESVAPAPRQPADIIVTQDDITDRPYRALDDLSVTVAKWTIFDADPTPAKVDQALRAKAAKLGADAVILVRYGTVGIGAFTWGKLEGKGRAVVFTK